MATRDIVVIGASAGGLEPIMQICASLPAEFPASIFIVQHTSPDNPGYLAGILTRQCALKATYPIDGELFQRGRIYVARPNHHLLLDSGNVIRVVQGPKENRSRPAVDPLFRSAALHYGARVTGVILSGGLDDGVAGLRGIKMCGGLSVVQSPADAMVDSMPRQALRFVSIDHNLPATHIGPLLVQIAGQPTEDAYMSEEAELKNMKQEVRAAKGELAAEEVAALGDPSLFTCPECHGALVRLRGQPTRFRCHTGHAFTADSLLGELRRSAEEQFWCTARSLQETAMLLEHLAGHARATDDPAQEAFRDGSQKVRERAQAVAKLGFENNEDIDKIISVPSSS